MGLHCFEILTTLSQVFKTSSVEEAVFGISQIEVGNFNQFLVNLCICSSLQEIKLERTVYCK